MLEHYGRIQQSDFDQIAEACVQVKERKNQTMGLKEAHLVPFLSPNECFTLEPTASITPNKASLNASLYTAAEGEFEGQGAESPIYTHLQHALENNCAKKSERGGKMM